MKEDFHYLGVLAFRKLAGLIGLIIAVYIPFAIVTLIGLSDKINSGEVSIGKAFVFALFTELFVVGFILVIIGAYLLGRKSITWLIE